MFDGVPADQFHQFLASRTTLPLPLSFPLHVTNPTFSSFDPYQPLQSHLLHPLHHPSPAPKENEKESDNSILSSTNLELERERSTSESELVDPWSNDEVLALLRIRSSMDNWFLADFTWEHVSRKLADVGFRRSAEKCKEKFEEESRYFDSINCNKSNRFFTSELEELCHGENTCTPNQALAAGKVEKMTIKPNDHHHQEEEEEDKIVGIKILEEDSSTQVANPSVPEVVKKSKSKRKRQHSKFEMLKGFCEDIVNKMMAQQEQLQNKLLEDMMKRDEEIIARDEAWKKKEMDRINKEIEIRAHEQVISGDRQAKIIEFLKSFTSSSQNQCLGERHDEILKVPKSSSPPLLLHQNPNVPTSSIETQPAQNPMVPTSSTLALTIQNPNSPLPPPSLSTNIKSPPNPNFEYSNDDREDHGKRWPRDEVLALINLRCSLYSSGEDKEGASSKAPLWERISQGMLELGYKRSAKRCKEKWENINKYFRKTKDDNKKRSLDSRTCPYFHQLSNLYKQGTLVAPPSEGHENRSSSPENHMTSPEIRSKFSQGVPSTIDPDTHVNAECVEKNVLQASPFDFEF